MLAERWRERVGASVWKVRSSGLFDRCRVVGRTIDRRTSTKEPLVVGDIRRARCLVRFVAPNEVRAAA